MTREEQTAELERHFNRFCTAATCFLASARYAIAEQKPTLRWGKTRWDEPVLQMDSFRYQVGCAKEFGEAFINFVKEHS